MKTKTFKVQNFTVDYYSNDVFATSIALNNSNYKCHITKFLKIYKKRFPINNIIDVGANFGYLTLLFAKEVVKNGHVFAFEPQPQNYELLLQNINKNNIDNIIAFPNACADKNGFVYIKNVNDEIHKNIDMSEFVLNEIDNIYTSRKANVFILDNLCYDEKEGYSTKFDVVKISANGSESYVLLGMQNICKILKPLIIIEFNNKKLKKIGPDSSDIANLLKGMNYKVFYLENQEFQTDHICVHNDMVNDFEVYFHNYILDHQSLNFINYNSLYVKEKIVIPKTKTILFFVRHFTMRGSEIAIFDYAKFNEDTLFNKSIIVCFTEKSQVKHTYNNDRSSFQKFSDRFTVLQIDNIDEISDIIELYNAEFFYTLVSGETEDMYKFSDRTLWKNCKTIKHCIYESRFPEGDYTIGVSECLNSKFGTNIPIIPHIIDLPIHIQSNLRQDLGIPSDAIVFGRYGSYDNFNIDYVKETILSSVTSNDNLYFVFMNTEQFCTHPKIKFLPHCSTDENKVKFINTCDAMIHAKKDGETFPLAICEFSLLNKPVITTSGKFNGHFFILKGKALIYRTSNELQEFFSDFKEKYKNSTNNWNCVEKFNPYSVMEMFDNEIFSKQ
jgi:FkbM family methyltransferase